MEIAVIGAGTVGRAVNEFFGGAAVVYDQGVVASADAHGVEACGCAFICVPTPATPAGDCDTSIVEQVVSWLTTDLIVICSTVAPGTTDRLRAKYDKRIVFQPEYIGETGAHPYRRIADCGFIVLGGPAEETSRVADLYKARCGASCRFFFCEAIVAELAKYMENAFYATKVTFANEFHDIAAAHGVEYNLLREIWLADPRIARDHTDVYPDARGFAGKCLPKDLSAIIASSQARGYMPKLLKAVDEINRALVGSCPDGKEITRA